MWIIVGKPGQRFHTAQGTTILTATWHIESVPVVSADAGVVVFILDRSDAPHPEVDITQASRNKQTGEQLLAQAGLNLIQRTLQRSFNAGKH